MRFIAHYRPKHHVPPSPEQQQKMGKYIADALEAGVLIATEGFVPGGKGDMKLQLSQGKLTVTDGPFSEAKEVVGGFAIMRVESREELLRWSKRFLELAGDGESEIRQLFDPSPIEMARKK